MLKCEVMLYWLLCESFGECDDFVCLIDWSFDEVLYFLEVEDVGLNFV